MLNFTDFTSMETGEANPTDNQKVEQISVEKETENV